jgi:HPt (histidine-containing phosphotransfer) domain-containing protein
MINSSPHDEEPSIQGSLLQLSTQLGQTLDQVSIDQLCQTAEDLLRNVSPAPVTLARVAGTLLVYHIQDPSGEELQWFKDQIEQCVDEEEVEEVIESIHRIDTL